MVVVLVGDGIWGVWAVGEEDVPLSDDVVLSHRRWFSVEGHLRWGGDMEAVLRTPYLAGGNLLTGGD